MSVKGKKNTMAAVGSCGISVDDPCSYLFHSVTFIYVIFFLNGYPSFAPEDQFQGETQTPALKLTLLLPESILCRKKNIC